MSLADTILAFDPETPLERAGTIPASWYRDPSIQEAERRTVFAQSWLVVGRSEVVAEPGTFLTAEIAGEPILVVRDEQGILRAFHNVCRHRAAPLLTEPCGRVSRLRCRYHGWTYDLAGKLRGVPEFEGVEGFCREDNGLAPLQVDTWGGYVWAHPEPAGVPLLRFLDPLPHQLAGMGMEALRFVERHSYDLACNWKVYVDNYLDGGYHISSVHPGLAGVLDYASYRIELAEWTSSQISPLRPAASTESQAVEQVRDGDQVWYCHVFPNFMLNVYRGYMDTNLVLPLGPQRCRVVFDYFFAPGESLQRIRDSIAVSDKIQIEDVGICEEVQRGLGSRAFQTGRYSVRRELAVHAFHCLLARQLRTLLTQA